MKKIGWVIRVPVGAEIKLSKAKKGVKGEVGYVLKNGRKQELKLDGWLKLSKKDQDKFEAINKDRLVAVGDLLWKKGIFNKFEIRSPVAGVVRGVNKDGNLMVDEGKEYVYHLPVDSQKIKIEKGKITLELEVEEISGIGLNQAKGWGKLFKKLVEDPQLIDNSFKDMVVVVEKWSEHLLYKAEALGVAGIICDKKADFESESEIPIVLVEKEGMEQILKLMKRKAEMMVWLNSVSGKVMVVLE